MNVFMMPQEPGKAVSNADVVEKDGVLSGADMLWLRRMVREELAQAVECFFARGLARLESAITAQPHDEQEEIVAVLATLSPTEFEAIVARVREHKV